MKQEKLILLFLLCLLSDTCVLSSDRRTMPAEYQFQPELEVYAR